MRLIIGTIFYAIAIIGALSIFDANALTCGDALNSCEEAVISQEASLKLCEEISWKKDELIQMVHEDVVATEKELKSQEKATTAGFSLSGLLLLLLLL